MSKNIVVTTPFPHGFLDGQNVYISGHGAPRHWFKRQIWRFGNAVARIGNRIAIWASRQKFTITSSSHTTVTLDRQIEIGRKVDDSGEKRA